VTPEDALELFAAVPVGILSVSRDGTVRGGNFAAARLLDLPLKDLTGRSIVDLVRPEDRAAFVALLREERFDERDLPFRTPEGERRGLRASGRPLPDGSLAIILRDTNVDAARDRRRLVEEKMAALGRLAAGVAHEFGNVMASLYGFAQLAQRDPSHKDDLIEAVAKAAGRVQQVTDALHGFEHVPSGELEPFDLGDVAQRVIAVLRPEIERANVRVDRVVEARTPVLGQRAPLEEAVLAIVRNAIEACSPGGVVTCTLSSERDRVVLAVADTGPGIRDEVRDRIFDPFFTTKGSLGGGPSASGGTGLGLGLAVAWNRIREHDGDLEFDSAGGRGTTFRITLPVRREQLPRRDVAPDRDARRPTQRRRPRRSVLLADGDASSRALVEAVLKGDHWVRAVGTGKEALAAYDAPRAFDYVVLDLALEGSPSGVEVFREIKVRDPRARIVLLTTGAVGDETVRACVSQAYALLRKPGELRDVRDLVT
jgi:signal transduction histidine kinase